VTIRQGETVVKILPDIGARVIAWRVGDSGNLMDAGTPETLERAEGWPEPPPKQNVSPGRGFTVWVGPQATWWTDQEKHPELKDKKATWPPDPILTLAPYEVLEYKANRVVLKSQVSPHTGIRLTKTFAIDAAGLVQIEVTAKNERDRTVKRNLWFNFRAPANGQDLVPLANIESAHYEHDADGAIRHGFHTLAVKNPGEKAKAFLEPEVGLMASTVPGGLIVIKFELPKAPVPSDHETVEIFRSQTQEKSPLLELEHHCLLYTSPSPPD